MASVGFAAFPGNTPSQKTFWQKYYDEKQHSEHNIKNSKIAF